MTPINSNEEEVVVKKNPIIKCFKKKKKQVKKFIFKVGGFMFSCFFSATTKINENQVLFLSDVRKDMGGNLGCVYDYIKDKGFDIIIEFKTERRDTRSISHKIRLMKEIATSRYILLDDYSDSIAQMYVRKNQDVVQLWHGPGAFKRIGYSRPDALGKRVLLKGHRNYTKAIQSSKEIEWIHVEGFGMEKFGEVKATGFPRTDCLFDEAYKKKVTEDFYKDYPEIKGKKIILFAPTYRGSSIPKAYYDFDLIDWDNLYETFKDDYVFIVKWHPGVYNNIVKEKIITPDWNKYKGFIYDMSSARDLNDILIVCNTLITDYSTSIFDYSILHKPVVYFVPDLDDYLDGRGLYVPFEKDVYGEVAKTYPELVEAIKSENMSEELREEFYRYHMGACDGHSTEKTCKWIFGDRV